MGHVGVQGARKADRPAQRGWRTLAVRTDFFEREALIRAAPDTFFFTDHYRNYPWVLVRLGMVERAQLAEMLEDAWRRVAPKRLVRAFEAERAKR